MEPIKKLVDKAQKHKGLLEGTETDVQRLRLELEKKEQELQALTVWYGDMTCAYKYLDTLVKEESGRFISRLEGILNYGLKTIFDDRDYRAKIVVDDGKRAAIHLVYEDEDGNQISPDVKDCGGGIRTVVGLLLQVFFLFHYKVEKLLIVDEGLSQVSSEYLPNLFGLLDELAKKNHLKVLLITHDSRMTEYASKQYVVEANKTREL